MEGQKSISKLEISFLVISILLFVASLIPFNVEFIISILILSVIVGIVAILIKKKLNKYFLIVLIINIVSVLTDISFLYYILYMLS